MIPRQVIKGCPDTTCLATYTYLDLRHGQFGPPPHGLQYIADELGTQVSTLKTHLGHLVAAGFIRVSPKLDAVSTNEAKSQTVVEVIHNPSRERFGPNVVAVSPRKHRYKKRSKYATNEKSKKSRTKEEPKPFHKENRTVPYNSQDTRQGDVPRNSDMSAANFAGRVTPFDSECGEMDESEPDEMPPLTDDGSEDVAAEWTEEDEMALSGWTPCRDAQAAQEWSDGIV
jgi:hypothetical protein